MFAQVDGSAPRGIGEHDDHEPRTYRYDAEQRLVSLNGAQGAYRFRYDAWGRRVIDAAGGATDTRHLWCGEALCQTRNASDTPTRYHYPQGELRGSQRLYYARDHRGSVREVRDLTTGLAVAAFDYTPYGASRAQSGSLTPDRGFAGMWRHAPTGLYPDALSGVQSGLWAVADEGSDRGGGGGLICMGMWGIARLIGWILTEDSRPYLGLLLVQAVRRVGSRQRLSSPNALPIFGRLLMRLIMGPRI